MRLHVIDGTFELFRAHYSRRPSRTSPHGQDVKGTVGVAASLLRLLADTEERVTHLAVAYDNPIVSFRNELFDGYKTGAGIDPAITAQFNLIEEMTEALGITVWSMDHFEADDALATAAARWRNEVDQVRLLTPDKDLGQSVFGSRVVQVDRMRRRVFDATGVRERNGVEPASIPDWLALVGDTADGIPGIPGFGTKTASILLNQYPTLEQIPENPDAWVVKVRGASRLAETLNSKRNEALLYRTLATLIDDVPITESLEDLEWHGADQLKYRTLSERIGGFEYEPRRWR